jgi:hypothetical protein
MLLAEELKVGLSAASFWSLMNSRYIQRFKDLSKNTLASVIPIGSGTSNKILSESTAFGCSNVIGLGLAQGTLAF